MIAHLQINMNGEWIGLATFEEASGGSGWLEYEHEYVFTHKDSPYARAGLLYPVNFDLYNCSAWPAFLMDILPSGAGRRVWLRRMGNSATDGPEMDWPLLLRGAGNPPGNIRVVEAVIEPPDIPHPGFGMEEIVDKNADFIEYAEEMGAVVAGATDIPGDAPKFMLVRDFSGRWHPDGSLQDNQIKDCWIVKFPRGKHENDFTVLRNEAPYYEVARWFGVQTGAPLMFRDNALFIPRFDRTPAEGKLLRHGLETVCSIADIPEFGKRGDHIKFCQAVAKAATNPIAEVLEYLKRDILNTAMRNVDNHGRNTAFLKKEGHKIQLSPLYDFAPMFLDPEGISRSSIWPSLEKSVGRPDWTAVAEVLRDLVDPHETAKYLLCHAEAVKALPAKMKELGVEDRVVAGVAQRCSEIGEDLGKVGAL